MFELEGIHHVSLSVTNITESKRFYGELLGFREIERPGFDFSGAWYQVGKQQLHLIEHLQSKTLRASEAVDSRDGHFAIRVKDYHQTLHYLKEKGVAVVEKPNSKSGFAQIFCTDPDGNVIEFNVDQEDYNAY